MTSDEPLERFGTAAFGIGYMLKTIVVDHSVQQGHVNAYSWFAAVPEVYHDDVLRVVTPVCQSYIGQHLTPATLHAMIQEMHDAVIVLTPRAVP